MSNYITEAFKQMALLESEDISLNADGIDKLVGFMDEAGVDPDEEMVDVFDLEAEAQEDLKDSYLGKVILECSVCHSHLFEDKANIDVNTDEEGLACHDLECPYCMSNEGYFVIGEVAPFSEAESEELQDEEEVESDLPDVDIEGGADDIDEEDLKESLDVSWDDNGFYDVYDNDPRMEKICDSLGITPENFESLEDVPKNLKAQALKIYKSDTRYDEEDLEESMKLDGVEELYDNDEIRGVDDLEGVDKLEGVKELHGEKHEAPINESMDSDELLELFLKYHEDLDNYRDNPEAFDRMYEILDKYGDEDEDVNKVFVRAPYEDQVKMVNLITPSNDIREALDPADRMTDEEKLKRGWVVNGKKRVLVQAPDGKVVAKIIDTDEPDSKASDFVKESLKSKKRKNLKENIEDVTVSTEDETMTMTTKEDGGVVIETSPKADEFGFEEAPMAGEEMIAPLSDESVDEIEAAADANTVEDGEEDMEFEDMAEEEFPIEDEFEEFDEESFNGLGESYLRSCYENVKGFKTIGVSVSGKNLFIEGVIKFDSGNEKKTKFVFEALGDHKFEGYNEQISRGKKTYKMTTSANNKKLVCETFNYNYRSRNELNESVRVYGTVKRK